MADEFEELRRANPVSADEAVELVATDRTSLRDAFESDSGPLPSRRPTRSMWAMAIAASVVVAVVAFALGNRVQDPVLVETATVTATSTGAASEIAPSPTTDTNETDTADTDDAVAAPLATHVFDPAADLLSVHLDFAHLDDGHAAVAAREVSTWFDLAPVVVAGTQSPDADSFVHEYATVMDAAWDSRWVDAAADRPEAVSGSLERWLGTLDAGGRVWVAEGGVSDFTAEVLREVARQRPDLSTVGSVHVVQHSQRNETETRQGDLAFVQANTTYERIDDGNDVNGTAGLNGASEAFATAALAGFHSARWAAAFEYFSAGELDFSDTVTMLHIVGVGVEEVANADDFAAFFMIDKITPE